MIDEEQQIEILLDLMKYHRIDDFDSWVEIGHLLYSVCPKYINLWLYFSSRYKNFEEEEALSQWEKYKDYPSLPHPLITLKTYAMIDSSDLYVYYFPVREIKED